VNLTPFSHVLGTAQAFIQSQKICNSLVWDNPTSGSQKKIVHNSHLNPWQSMSEKENNYFILTSSVFLMASSSGNPNFSSIVCDK
jgi:hypothetical protein